MTGRKDSRSAAERASLALSLLVLAAVIAAIVYVGLTPANSPSRFRIVAGEIRPETNVFYLHFEVINEGDETGKKVKVTGKLGDEIASTVFDNVAGHSVEKAVLIFHHEPSGARLQVESYQRP